MALCLVSAGHADEAAEKGRRIFLQHQQEVVTVQILARTRISMPGRNAQTNEARHSVSGTVVTAAGLTAVSLSAMDPGQALKSMAAAKDPRLKVEPELAEIKIVFAPGMEMLAEVALRDADLDLAFVRPKVKPATPVTAADLTNSGTAEPLEQVIALNRLGTAAGGAYSASVERIAAVVEQPRRFYVPDANMTTATLGAPAFTLDGKVLGVFLIRNIGTKTAVGMLDAPAENLTGIILPAAEILKAIPRVPVEGAKDAK